MCDVACVSMCVEMYRMQRVVMTDMLVAHVHVAIWSFHGNRPYNGSLRTIDHVGCHLPTSYRCHVRYVTHSALDMCTCTMDAMHGVVWHGCSASMLITCTCADDIGGMEAIKESIYETVILPLQSPELFQALNRENTRCERHKHGSHMLHACYVRRFG